MSGAATVGPHGITGPEGMKIRSATPCHTHRPTISPIGTPMTRDQNQRQNFAMRQAAVCDQRERCERISGSLANTPSFMMASSLSRFCSTAMLDSGSPSTSSRSAR